MSAHLKVRPTAPLPQRPPVAPVPLLEAQVKELQVQIRQLMAQVLGLEARMKDLGPRTGPQLMAQVLGREPRRATRPSRVP